jgi:peptide chain release factor 1
LSHETGGSRVQRVSPTEKRGRVHTSTITIAVIDPEISLNHLFEQRGDGDFKIEWFQSLGGGGQNANKHHNCCRITHIPTGLRQEHKGKSRESNKKQAKEALIRILDEKSNAEKYGKIADIRKGQVGTGMRGDKVRTLRHQDNIAKNHLTGRSCQVDKLMDGYFDLLW